MFVRKNEWEEERSKNTSVINKIYTTKVLEPSGGEGSFLTGQTGQVRLDGLNASVLHMHSKSI